MTTAGVALSPWFVPVLVLILLAGLADAIVMVADRSIQQRRTPDVVRSRVVSASESVITIALAAGFVLGGPALELLGPEGRLRARRGVRVRRGGGAAADPAGVAP